MYHLRGVGKGSGSLRSSHVKGAFWQSVRAKCFLSTIFMSYFCSCEKEKETSASGRSKQLRNGFLACEGREVAMLFSLCYLFV